MTPDQIRDRILAGTVTLDDLEAGDHCDDDVYAASQEIRRLRAERDARDSAQVTHWADGPDAPGCWRHHLGCAVAEVERLRSAVSSACHQLAHYTLTMEDEAERLRADLAEARAEIAAYRGLPEGGLPGWERNPYTRNGYRREEGGTVLTSGGVDGARWMVTRAGTADYASGWTDTPRAAMRAAEAEAVRRGWLPGEGA